MVLILQLDAELPKDFPGHERRLYVFACKRKSCRRREGSTSVVRGLRVEPGAAKATTAAAIEKKKEDKKSSSSVAPKPAQTGLGEALFGSKGLGTSSGGANPFATGPASGGGGGNPFGSNPFSTPAPAQTKQDKPEELPSVTNEPNETSQSKTAVDEAKEEDLPKTFAQTLSLNNPQESSSSSPPSPPEPWPTEAEQPAPYPVSYLSEAEYETLDPTPQTIPQATRMEVDDPASSSGGGGKEDKEVFESTMDFDFQKFADRLEQNPEQSIRYEFAGQPLLYSKTDAVGKALSARGMPGCGNCGARRTFEVQLCPHAITELESEEMSLDGMDWGTIIVGVCERDCQARGVKEGEAGYLQEWAGVQWEELTAQRR